MAALSLCGGRVVEFNITELDAAKVDQLNDEEIAATAAALAGSNVIRLHAINPWPEDDGADMGTKEMTPMLSGVSRSCRH